MKINIRYCKLADKDHKRKKRWYAHTHHVNDHICVSQSILDLNDSQFYAVIAHEIGHILVGPQKSERAANTAANKYFNIKILYRDSSNGKMVETVSQEDLKKLKRKILVHWETM